MNSTETIDKTIDAICNWLQETIKACPSSKGDYAYLKQHTPVEALIQ